jgi:hypothetical protein
VDILISLLLGISLSAACGFRVFVPLLVVSIAAVFWHLGLPADVSWIGTDQALIVFAVASILEIIGYSIPWFDHLLELGAIPLAMAAGTFVTASASPEMNPLVQWVTAIAVGGGTAGIIRGLMGVLRMGSTATSGGLANPLLTVVEVVISAGLSLLAIAFPVLAGILVASILLYATYRLRRHLLSPQSQPVSSDEPTS